MDGLILTPRSLAEDRPEQFLTAIPVVVPATAVSPASSSAVPESLASSSEILVALGTNPSQDTVVQSLQLLDSSFDVRTPSAVSSRIIKVLLETTLSDFWHVLSKKERALLARCLASPTGLGGIVSRLKVLIPRSIERDGGESQTCRENLGNLLALLQMVLGHKGFVREIWTLAEKEPEIKRDILWKEFTALVAGGRLLSVAAEAESTLGRLSRDQRKRWVGDGRIYALWLGREMAEASLLIESTNIAGWKAQALFLIGSFRLGYTDKVVEGITYKLINPEDESPRLQNLVSLLPAHDKRSYLISLLRVISTQHLQSTYLEGGDKWWEHDATKVSGAAALLEKIILDDSDFQSLIMEWLTSSTGGGIGEPFALRRVIMAVVVKDELAFRELSERLLQQFSDKLWIKHTPTIRQEVNVQILLLCAGHSYRHSPSFLERLTRSSNFLNGVSNRLAAPLPRARFLGMIVGECFSTLVDEDPKMKMTFGIEETETDEAKWWKSIPLIEDKIGSLQDLFTPSTTIVSKKQKPRQPSPKTVPATAIQIANDDISDDGFAPYALPDSDPKDASDEDATTIDRNKPTSPVYIRDLLTYFHATDSYDRQYLALTHAAPLIRRKSAVAGSKEVSTHLFQLAAALAGIDDRFEISSFTTLRTAGLVALVVTNPTAMGQWLARQFYIGDYGLSQRATLLVAIGIGARELAGFEPLPPLTPAPHLPSKVAMGWSRADGEPIAVLAASLKGTLLAPLAATTADKHDILKLSNTRMFSSRIAVTARRTPPAHRAILDLAGPAFFFPLTGGWASAARDWGGMQPQAVPELVCVFLDTLSVVFHAAGPAATGVVEMGGELLAVVAAVRGRTGVERACMLAVLTVMEVGGRRVMEEFADVVREVLEWVRGMFDDAHEEETRVLAAGVLVKVAEVEEGWRKRLMAGLRIEDEL